MVAEFDHISFILNVSLTIINIPLQHPYPISMNCLEEFECVHLVLQTATMRGVTLPTSHLQKQKMCNKVFNTMRRRPNVFIPHAVGE